MKLRAIMLNRQNSDIIDIEILNFWLIFSLIVLYKQVSYEVYGKLIKVVHVQVKNVNEFHTFVNCKICLSIFVNWT